MLTLEEAWRVQGRRLLGPDGEKIGKIESVYADHAEERATFAVVSNGFLGSTTNLVPLDAAELRGEDVVVPYDKELVTSAPYVEDEEELGAEDEDLLYAHYGVVRLDPDADEQAGVTDAPEETAVRRRVRRVATATPPGAGDGAAHPEPDRPAARA